MWGGTPDRNMVSNMKGLPLDWDVKTKKNVKWVADLGSQTYGNAQEMKIEPWNPETVRSAHAPFEWKADTWYHLKLQVENLPDGKVRARGKAWPTGQPEPAAWMIEKIDPIGNKKGAPGFFVDSEFGAYIDNIKVTSNQ